VTLFQSNPTPRSRSWRRTRRRRPGGPPARPTFGD